MANGYDPECVTCRNFETRPKGTREAPVVLTDPAVDCRCILHRVHLPISQTRGCLICREWASDRTEDRLVDWPSQGQFLAGVLYGYENIYTPGTRVVAEIKDLPPLSQDG